MSSHNSKFTFGLLTAGIFLIFLIDESIARQIRSPKPFSPRTPQNFKDPELPCRDDGDRNEFYVFKNGQLTDECDCLPPNLHYIKDDKCYKPYTQGPCETEQYLVLTENKNKLECADNPCGDNEVPYEGSCYSLDTKGPCDGQDEILQISSKTHKPECLCANDYFPYEETNVCYQFYSQGPCKEDYALVLTSDGQKLVCHPLFQSKYFHPPMRE